MFDNGRYFFPWTPIKVSPIGVERFFSQWGLAVMKNEILVVWLPLSIFWVVIFAAKKVMLKKHPGVWPAV
jgi:inner membrane protein